MGNLKTRDRFEFLSVSRNLALNALGLALSLSAGAVFVDLDGQSSGAAFAQKLPKASREQGGPAGAAKADPTAAKNTHEKQSDLAVPAPDTAVSSDGKEIPPVDSTNGRAGGDATTGGAVSEPYVGTAGNGAAGNDGSIEAPSDGAGAQSGAPAVVDAAAPAQSQALTPEQEAANEKAMLQNEAVDHYEAARAYLHNLDFDLADVELRASIMCMPHIRASHRDYALVSLLRGHPGRALAEFMIVVGLGDAIPYSDEQKEAIKNDGLKLHYRQGLALAAQSKWADSIVEFEWAKFYRPNAAKVTRSIAFAYASEGKFDLAEKQYAESFAIDPSDAYGHADFAFLLAAKGSAERAVEQLNEAVKLQPKVAALHVDLGWMAESKGDLAKAESEFQEAIKLAPRQATLWTHLGKLQARQGKSELAMQAYKEALAIDPQQLDASEGLQRLDGSAGKKKEGSKS